MAKIACSSWSSATALLLRPLTDPLHCCDQILDQRSCVHCARIHVPLPQFGFLPRNPFPARLGLRNTIASQRIFVRLDLNLEGPARHYSCAGNSGRFSGAKLLKAGFRFSAFGFRQPSCSERRTPRAGSLSNSFRRPQFRAAGPRITIAFSNSDAVTGFLVRHPKVLVLNRRPRGRHPLRCDPPASEN